MHILSQDTVRHLRNTQGQTLHNSRPPAVFFAPRRPWQVDAGLHGCDGLPIYVDKQHGDHGHDGAHRAGGAGAAERQRRRDPSDPQLGGPAGPDLGSR